MSIIKESLMSKINEQEFSGTLDNTSEFKNAITHIKTVLKNKSLVNIKYNIKVQYMDSEEDLAHFKRSI